jgi:hypothetical protein
VLKTHEAEIEPIRAVSLVFFVARNEGIKDELRRSRADEEETCD